MQDGEEGLRRPAMAACHRGLCLGRGSRGVAQPRFATLRGDKKAMPIVELRESEHAPGIRPVRIHYREWGTSDGGAPVVFLHGGWGYGVYPIDLQVAAFAERVRFVAPERSGYGGSVNV